MSRSVKKAWVLSAKHWAYFCDTPWKCNAGFNWSGGGPAWYTRLHDNIPKRREEKLLEKLSLRLSNEDANDLIWPLARKPREYYY